jgi:hypothetical protein
MSVRKDKKTNEAGSLMTEGMFRDTFLRFLSANAYKASSVYQSLYQSPNPKPTHTRNPFTIPGNKATRKIAQNIANSKLNVSAAGTHGQPQYSTQVNRNIRRILPFSSAQIRNSRVGWCLYYTYLVYAEHF